MQNMQCVVVVANEVRNYLPVVGYSILDRNAISLLARDWIISKMARCSSILATILVLLASISRFIRTELLLVGTTSSS